MVMANIPMRSIWAISCAAIIMLAACGDASIDNPELNNPDRIASDIVQEEELPAIPSREQAKEPEEAKTETPEIRLPDPVKEDPPEETGTEVIEWGQEIDLAEMIAKARSGEIQEIQWHVMPNVLRAQTLDDRIFHLKNENKGVDLRNALIDAGVQIGSGGVIFRHVF